MSNGIDTLKLLSGKPIHITDKIVYSQPKLQDVINFGEKEYYNILSNLTMIPSEMKSVLWDIGIDWNNLSDIELFSSLSKTMTPDKTGIFFEGIDFTKFILLKDKNDDIIMYDQDNDIKIDFYVYKKMQDCLCKSHSLKKKVEKAGNIYTKKVLIEEDRQNRERNKDNEFKSVLYELISSMVNYSGFKYDYETVFNLTMFQFMDAVQRSRIIDSTNHLLNGVYAGTIDTKKMSSEKFNWMRDISKE